MKRLGNGLSHEKNIEGVFLRYRNGGIMMVNPDIKEKVREIIPKLEESEPKIVFKEIIKGISDGNGWGVHLNSTWFCAVKELYDTYERYQGNPSTVSTQKALIGLLKLLVEGDQKTKINWDKTRDYIIEKIDDLSPIPDRYLTTFDGKEVRREQDGKYYYDDDEYGKVQELGLRTPVEETLQFYTNDTQMKFGRLYRILRFIALFDIAYEYTNSPSDFPKLLSCTLYDNDGGSTNYLDWQWQMPIPFDFVPLQWHPRSPFSNPDWLSTDLVMHLPFLNSKPQEAIIPNPPKNESLESWKSAFSGYKWQLEIPVVTNVLIGERPEEYFDFFDRKIRWVNGNAFIQPILIVPANDDDGKDGIEIARKFLSVLNIENEITLSEQLISQQQIRYLPWFRQPRISIFHMINPDYAMPRDDYKKFSQKKWYALAFMREATSSNSIYYSFLNYYKVIELANRGESSRTIKWINSNVKRICTAKNIDWYEKKVIKQGERDPGYYLFKTERTAIAHAVYTLKGENTHSPDDPGDWQRTKEDLVVIIELAKDIIVTL